MRVNKKRKFYIFEVLFVYLQPSLMTFTISMSKLQIKRENWIKRKGLPKKLKIKYQNMYFNKYIVQKLWR